MFFDTPGKTCSAVPWPRDRLADFILKASFGNKIYKLSLSQIFV